MRSVHFEPGGRPAGGEAVGRSTLAKTSWLSTGGPSGRRRCRGPGASRLAVKRLVRRRAAFWSSQGLRPNQKNPCFRQPLIGVRATKRVFHRFSVTRSLFHALP